MTEPTNRQRKRDQRARQKAAREAQRRDNGGHRDRPSVAEQFSRPVTRESIEDEMRRRGLLR